MMNFLVAFEPVILVVHFLAAFFLITVILLQAGKGTDIGSMFGVGGSQSLFGARGAATFLSKMTTTTAILFLFTSLGLATISNHAATGGPGSVIQSQAENEGGVAPAAEEPAKTDDVSLQPPATEAAEPAAQPSNNLDVNGANQ